MTTAAVTAEPPLMDDPVHDTTKVEGNAEESPQKAKRPREDEETSSVNPSTTTATENKPEEKHEESQPAEASSGSQAKRPRFDDKKRGQRFFGSVLLGTLTKFKETTAKKSEADLRREELLKRQQEKQKQLNEELAEKSKQEAESRRARILAHRQAEEERRMTMTKQVSTSQATHLSNFIKTKTNPPIFFLPGKNNSKTNQALAAAQEALQAQLKAEEEQEEARRAQQESKDAEIAEKSYNDVVGGSGEKEREQEGNEEKDEGAMDEEFEAPVGEAI
ncbi:hypothetical protein HDU76_012380 [Blyttiomyces sp. JEL0837]|nr:hypothetical protein HDU76_012380 [Blyttiomyces sp. JEL0837]